MISMSKSNQYQDDKKRLATLLEKHTGVDAKSIIEHIDKFGAGALLSGAVNICKTETQRQKLTSLFELKNVYEAVKSADNAKEYILDSPDASKDYFKKYFADIADKEHVVAAFTNSRHKVITTKHISAGTINSAVVNFRDIVKEAIFCNAVNVVVAHNHPSGDCQASSQDIDMTKTLEFALSAVRVKLIDHIIVAGDNAVSFANTGNMPESSFELASSRVAFSEKCKTYDAKQPSVKKQLANIKSQRSLELNTQADKNRSGR